MSKDFFKKIVVAINGSESSIHAAMYGIMMARCYGCKLKAVYVVDMATIKYLSMNKFLISEESSDFETALTDEGNNSLKYIERLALSKGVKIETELRKGGVYSELSKCCQEYGADVLLVGGSEVKAGEQRKTKVSDAERDLLLSAPFPILVVKKPEIERLFKGL